MLPPVFTTPVASTVPSDGAVTGLTADNVEAALAEIAGTGVQLRTKTLSAAFTLPFNTFAFWCQTLDIDDGVVVELMDQASLEIS